MTERISHINSARFMEVDERDWRRMRDRILWLEEEHRRILRELALFQQGVKERLDVFGVLLSQSTTEMARKDME